NQLNDALRVLPAHVDLTTATTIGHVWRRMRKSPCAGISEQELAKAAASMADRSPQPINSFPIAYLHNAAAEMYSSIGDWDMALEQSLAAWQPNTDPSGAVVLIQALLKKGRVSEAEAVYAQAERRVRPHN